MKLVIPVSLGRVATALDFARHLLLVEFEADTEVRRTEFVLDDTIPLSRARRLEALGTHVLLCGAVSRALAEHLESSGIEVVPFVSGPVDEVLAAYLAGNLDSGQFLMPGSTAEQRWQWRHHHPVR
jgi:predicted Fe-Mo cluster-binding NifX family protein